MTLLRIVNAFYAALFLVMALVSLAFLSADLNDAVREPAAAWVAVGWMGLLVLYAALVFLNMRRVAADGAKGRLIALNAAAAVPLLAGLVAADPAGRFLCGVAAFPFTVTAATLLIRRRETPA
jgi:hypothetical protein